MRLWSIHPKYLDSKGLVALWREGLLAKKVLEGKTRSYKKHPQLERFKKADNPIEMIDSYLWFVHEESMSRGYKFDKNKVSGKNLRSKTGISRGQLLFEMEHLKRKLLRRDKEMYRKIKNVKTPETNPVFFAKKGPIEAWERINNSQ